MSGIQSCFKRYEKKYLLTEAQYEAMRLGMADYMKPDEHPRYSISNIYYDTEHYDLIRASLEKPVYKEKLRMRSYGVPDSRDTVFVELKKKYDGVVYKRRITMEMQDAALYLYGARKGDGSQISREIDYFLRLYQPERKVFKKYTRTADLERVKTTNVGTLYELCYKIVLRDTHKTKAFMDELRTRNGNLNIVCGKPVEKTAL